MSRIEVDVNLSIHNTLGACLVGFAVSCIIYGILLTMIYTYFSRYPEDRSVYKYLVWLLLVLETADQTFIAHLIYYYGVINFGSPIALIRGSVTWSFILQQTVGAIVGFFVKTAFAMRVWRFSERNFFITGLILVLTFGQLVVAIIFSVRAFQLPGVFAVAQLRVVGTISLAIGVGTDFIIAGALCFYLRKLKTGYKRSDSLVNMLVRFAINTGVVTSAVSLATLLIYNIMPNNNLIFVATYFILSKLYAISFLATLNTRRVVRGRGTDRNTTNSNGNSRSQRHTNIFNLGTRVPSITDPAELEGWSSPMSKDVGLASPGQAHQRPELVVDTLGYHGINPKLSPVPTSASPLYGASGLTPGAYKQGGYDRDNYFNYGYAR